VDRQIRLKMLIFVLLLIPVLLLARNSGVARSAEPSETRESVQPAEPSQLVDSTRPSATLSGTIRHNHNPVSGVSVTVDWAIGYETQTTGANGTYSVSGVPTGAHNPQLEHG
jgi:hypothetical protein